MRLIKYIKYRFFLRFLSKEEQKKFHLASIRAHFAVFGRDISNYTDDELEQGFIDLQRVSRAVGVTTKEAESLMSEALKSYEKHEKTIIQ